MMAAATTAAPVTSAKTSSNGHSNGHGNGDGKATKIGPNRVPRALSTPTDLKPDEVAKVTEIINAVVADHFALYVKTKNFHWHLASSHFRDYHLMFDEQAETIFESIDPLAERVRKIGGTTVRSIGHIGRLTSIADDDEDFVSAPEMIQRLIEDNKASAAKCREAIEITDEARDYPTNDLLQQVLDAAERRIWFLYQVSTGGENEN